MGIGRSTFYDTPDACARELTIVADALGLTVPDKLLALADETIE